MLDVVTIKDFWIIFPSLLVPIIAFFLGRFGHYTDRKLEYRTFLESDPITAIYKLKNMPNIKSGTRLLIPDEYISLKKEIDTGSIPPTVKLTYLKIKSYGKSIVTNVWISVTLRDDDTKKSWYLDISLPTIDKDEEIFIPMDSLDRLDFDFYIAEIKMTYQTQAGEKLRYTSKRTRNAIKEIVVKNSHSVKKYHLFYHSISSAKGSNVGWIYLDNDKDKTNE
ncbi:MAG: hypothetical protein ACQEW5_09460 [Bacillota bacterium]